MRAGVLLAIRILVVWVLTAVLIVGLAGGVLGFGSVEVSLSIVLALVVSVALNWKRVKAIRGASTT
ncbi:hypothetical protein GCM10012275_56450 [Longimycelium tulufanense]|uniref:Uncharacterized protein n=1 Tax=Longimycelium tulufanense TaxID=907463 RepID=A0A8J3CDK4_9PSEU|nr:hypothetical protein [Longimycelium tulufanense]GGM78538.1 hypothetical protein GCM10012275_56450 [Longimycelium tulufanense]